MDNTDPERTVLTNQLYATKYIALLPVFLNREKGEIYAYFRFKKSNECSV